MSQPKEPRPVKLVASIFSPRKELIGEALRLMSEKFGPTDYLSRFIPFDYTDYYREEMGGPLIRRFASFEALIDPSFLPEIKLFTNGIEDRFARWKEGREYRPGLPSEFHLVLATGKGYAHRPYLRDGI